MKNNQINNNKTRTTCLNIAKILEVYSGYKTVFTPQNITRWLINTGGPTHYSRSVAYSMRFYSKTNHNSFSNPFTSNSKYSYTYSKNRITIPFNIGQFRDFDLFYKRISDNVPFNHYIVYFKIRYRKDDFVMGGSQWGLVYIDHSMIVDLHNEIDVRLENACNEYHFGDQDIVYILLFFRKLNVNLLSEFKLDTKSLDRKYYPSSDIASLDVIGKVPLSANLDDVLKPIECVIKDGVIVNVPIKTNKGTLNFLDEISKQNKFSTLRKRLNDGIIDSFSSNYQFFMFKNSKPYILCMRYLDELSVEKLYYSINGALLRRVKDTIQQDGTILREFNKYKIYISNNKVIKIVYNVSLIPIQYKKEPNLPVENINIGALDTETILTSEGNRRIYTLGFRTKLERDPVIFFVDTLNPDYDSTVLKFINELLRSKYQGIKFYCHNWSGYDVAFFLGVILRYNSINKDDPYIIEPPVFRDGVIIKLVISKNINSIKRRIHIQDSYCLLTASQDALCKSFNVENKKTIFPYDFSTESNINYVGKTPDIEYYNKITKESYNSLLKDDWSFKIESIEYLKNDINGLYQILCKANKSFFLQYNIDCTKSLTISSIALRYFLQNHYKNNIPSIKDTRIYKDIKQAYYGGITEVYRPYTLDSFYYDVNSLYPSAGLNPMPGLKCDRIDFFNNDARIANYFGFFYCEIECNGSYIGLLPVRDKNGLIFPMGKWRGWYFSEELKFVEENGYKIKMINGYNFSKEYNVFTEYINRIYAIKSNTTNPIERSLAKSLLNNLLGRFGIDIEKPITEIMDEETFNVTLSLYKVVSYIQLENDNYMVTFTPKLDYDIITGIGLDISKIATDSKYSDESTYHSSPSVAISAAVTSYSRIHMNKIKLGILKAKGKIFYSDTDSIVTDMKLPEHMVSNTELGKLKLEHVVKKGIFITGKTYSIINDKGNIIKRAKGVNSSSLEFKDYESLLDNKNVISGVKTQSKKDYLQGSVNIFNKNVTLKHDVYKRRVKLYENGVWVNTQPININNICTEIIVWNPKLSLIIYNPYEYKPINTNSYRNIYMGFITGETKFVVYLGLLVIIGLYFISLLFNEDDSIDYPEEVSINSNESKGGYIHNTKTQSEPFHSQHRETIVKQTEYEEDSNQSYDYDVIDTRDITIKDSVTDTKSDELLDLDTNIYINTINYHKNALLEVLPGGVFYIADTNKSKEIEDILKHLVEHKSPLNSPTNSEFEELEYEKKILSIRTAFDDSEEGLFNLLKEMNYRKIIRIYSPASDVSDAEELVEYEISPTEKVKDINEVILTAEDKVVYFKAINLGSKKTFTVITKKLEEGEPIPSLPSWVNISQFSEDYHIKRKRLDNLMKSDYVNNHKDNTKPSTRGQEWLETDSNYNLDLLYKEEPHESTEVKSSSKNNNLDWMEEEESYNLEQLFDQKK